MDQERIIREIMSGNLLRYQTEIENFIRAHCDNQNQKIINNFRARIQAIQNNQFDTLKDLKKELKNYTNRQVNSKTIRVEDGTIYHDHCDHKLLTGVIKTRITGDLPIYLIITFPRFEISFLNGALITRKNQKPVKYPIDLDLSPYLDQRRDDVKYELVSGVYHTGSLNGGHYISKVKKANNQWYYISDDMINKISENQVGDIDGYTATILIYRKVFFNY